jgi:hypothetical protein
LLKGKGAGECYPRGTLRISIECIFLLSYILWVEWSVEFTDEFEAWWDSLTMEEQEDVRASVNVLRQCGPSLGRPHVDAVAASRYSNMKELRTQHAGRPYRTLFAFDPRRVAILLIGGDKAGNNRWYAEFVPLADKIYAGHLKEIAEERNR